MDRELSLILCGLLLLLSGANQAQAQAQGQMEPAGPAAPPYYATCPNVSRIDKIFKVSSIPARFARSISHQRSAEMSDRLIAAKRLVRFATASNPATIPAI